MTNEERKEILEKYRIPMSKIYDGHRKIQKSVLILRKSWKKIDTELKLLKKIN